MHTPDDNRWPEEPSPRIVANDNLYASYRRFHGRLAELRAAAGGTAAGTDDADPTGSTLTLMTREQFEAWWNGLDADKQEEYAALYGGDVNDVVRETATALREQFLARQPEPWQVGR